MSWFRNLFSPKPVEPADIDEPTGEEDIVRNEGEADIEQMENVSGGAGVPGLAAPEAAETVEAELSEYEKPQDLGA
jgi:hypothetical protein